MPLAKPAVFAVCSAFAIAAVGVAATVRSTMDVTEILEATPDDDVVVREGVTQRTAPFSPDIRFSSPHVAFVPPPFAPPPVVLARSKTRAPKAPARRAPHSLMVAMKLDEPQAAAASIDLDEVTTTPAPATVARPRQQRPAAGAIMAALRAVMPGARVCLRADEDVTTAVVVFRGDGSVARVDHANACVRDALARAHVDAFTDATFSTPVTVRR